MSAQGSSEHGGQRCAFTNLPRWLNSRAMTTNSSSPGHSDAQSASRRLRVGILIALLCFILLQGINLIFRMQARDHGKMIGHLPPFEFEKFGAILAGTGTDYENPTRLGPTTVIGLGQTLALVDCGMASAQALRNAGIPVRQIETIYLTSLLPENVLGLDDLLFASWLSIEPREKPLRLVGPPGTRALAERLLAAYRTSIDAKRQALHLPDTGLAFDVIEIQTGQAAASIDASTSDSVRPKADVAATEAAENSNSTTLDSSAPDWVEELPSTPKNVTQIRVHASASNDAAFAKIVYRFEAAGKAIVVTGVDGDPSTVTRLAKDADVLIHEAYYWDPRAQLAESGMDPTTLDRLAKESSLHTAASDVARIAADAGVKTLVLTRLRPPPMYGWQFLRLLGPEFHGRIVVANDGETITP